LTLCSQSGGVEALSGTIQSWTTTTNTTYPGNPNFGQGSGVGSILFTGGLAPYIDEVLALTDGTGIAQLGSTRFNAVCSTGSDPCSFSLDATLTFVPEPTTALLVGLAMTGLAVRRRIEC
jgi:hypothetical protein